MAPPCNPSPQKRWSANDDDNNMMLAAAPGCTSAATCMSSFANSSMEQDDETDWDSESDKPPWRGYCLVGMSNEDWAKDNIDMGDYPAHADEPLTISASVISILKGSVATLRSL